jgi:hypothetical protein
MDSSEENINQTSSNNDSNIKSFASATSASISASRNPWQPLPIQPQCQNELNLTYNPAANSKTAKPNSNDCGAISGQTKQPGRGAPAASSVNNNNQPDDPSRRPTQNYTPTRKNAIIIENTQEVSQEKCLRAVADVIGGHNIHYCSKLSGGRFCVYLTSQKYVEQMCDEGVSIDYEYFPCRRYVTQSTKYIISNCPPEFSDEQLVDLLQPYGKISSPVTRLRVSTNHEDLRHIKTWRRSIFMLIPSNAPPIPKRILLTNPEGQQQAIYIEKDDIMCSYCMSPGHPVEKCKKKQNHETNFPPITPSPRQSKNAQSKEPLENKNTHQEPNTEIITTPNSTQTQSCQQTVITTDPENTSALKNLHELSPPVPTIVNEINTKKNETTFNKSATKKKRSHSPGSDYDYDSSTSTQSDVSDCNKSRQPNKKTKKQEAAIQELMKNIKKEDSHPLEVTELQSFLQQCRGKANSKRLAQKFTNDISGLIQQLQSALLLCSDFNLQRRLTRAVEALTLDPGEEQ